MSYSFIAGGAQSIGGSPSSDIITTGANLLIGCVSAALPSPTPSDNKSNTWHEAARIAGGFSGDSVIYYAYGSGIVVGSNHNFTANGTTPSGCFMAFSGATTTDPLDQVSAGDNQAHTVQPGSITPSQNGCLIVLVQGDVESTQPSIDSGFTIVDFIALSGGVNYQSADAYLIQLTAAGINPTLTSNSGTNFGMNTIQVSFLPAASGARLSRLSLLGAG